MWHKIELYKPKKHRCCASDSNLGQQDGRSIRIHCAMTTAPYNHRHRLAVPPV